MTQASITIKVTDSTTTLIHGQTCLNIDSSSHHLQLKLHTHNFDPADRQDECFFLQLSGSSRAFLDRFASLTPTHTLMQGLATPLPFKGREELGLSGIFTRKRLTFSLHCPSHAALHPDLLGECNNTVRRSVGTHPRVGATTWGSHKRRFRSDYCITDGS